MTVLKGYARLTLGKHFAITSKENTDDFAVVVKAVFDTNERYASYGLKKYTGEMIYIRHDVLFASNEVTYLREAS